jgi:hypothetical protein
MKRWISNPLGSVATSSATVKSLFFKYLSRRHYLHAFTVTSVNVQHYGRENGGATISALPTSTNWNSMDQLDQLKNKYNSVLEFIKQSGVHLTHLHVQDNKLFIQGERHLQRI